MDDEADERDQSVEPDHESEDRNQFVTPNPSPENGNETCDATGTRKDHKEIGNGGSNISALPTSPPVRTAPYQLASYVPDPHRMFNTSQKLSMLRSNAWLMLLVGFGSGT